MLKNYLMVALRNLRKHPGHTAINISGLAVAIGACLLIGLYIRHELSFDTFHAHVDQIYRVGEHERAGEPYAFITRARLLPTLVQTSPAVEAGTRTFGAYVWMQRGDGSGQRFQETGLHVDSTFFQVFSFPLVAGDAATALHSNDGIVLTESLARKYFGDEDPMGQALIIEQHESFTVRGVMPDFPTNSTVQADFLLPYSRVAEAGYLDWNNTLMPTYVRLAERAAPKAVVGQMEALIAEHAMAERQAEFTLVPLRDFHLFTEGVLIEGASKRALLVILATIALAILLVAAINVANLATARALTRAREIGMRKVLGAWRLQLAAQFLGEALLLTALATLGGVALAEFLLPSFNHVLDLSLTIDYLADPPALLFPVGIWLAVGVLAGSYPALHLSGFRPIASVKGRLQHDPRGARTRNVLVVAQFALSVVLIIGTIVIWQQVQYMKSQDLNVEIDNVLVIPVAASDFAEPETGATRIATLKDELLRHSRITEVSSSESVPGQYRQWSYPFFVGETDERVQTRWTRVDEQYFATYGMEIVEGRVFSDSLATDVGGTAVINETARRAFGWDSAVGKTIRWSSQSDPIEIIGVVADFHYQSLEAPIEPLVHFYAGPSAANYFLLSAKLSPGPLPPVMAYVQEQLQALDPSRTFDYFFVDDRFEALYAEIERRGQLVSAFAVLAVLIGCLGLFGLAAFAAEQRTKEIGIRKVFGATMLRLVALLSKDFLILVGIAFAVAAPAAYFLMHRWLDDFAYRIDISWPIFLVSGLLALGVTLFTVSYQAVRAALANPVDSLRYE